MPIQPRTSLLKFGHLAVKSGKGTVLYLSTKVQSGQKHAYLSDTEPRWARFIFRGTMHSEANLAIVYPAGVCFGAASLFTLQGMMMLPRLALYAIEYVEVVNLTQDSVMDVLHRYPSKLKGTVAGGMY